MKPRCCHLFHRRNRRSAKEKKFLTLQKMSLYIKHIIIMEKTQFKMYPSRRHITYGLKNQ